MCLDGIVAFVQRGPDSLVLAISIADQVSADISRARGQQKYEEILEWAESHGEGDRVQVGCRLREFAVVEGAPEPMVIPVFGFCNLHDGSNLRRVHSSGEGQ